ncbi:MAG: flagellar basal body P-ring protein FlgI [Phycisphaerales bacterium JB039]
MAQITHPTPMTGRGFFRAGLALAIGALAVCQFAAPASGARVREMVRIEGQSESVLIGIGLVVGLPGTGDDGEALRMARPLMALLEKQGVPIGDPSELEGTRSAALVELTAIVPLEGGRTSDRLDVHAQAIGDVTSLRGGRLVISPLTSHLPGSDVYALAEGRVIIEDDSVPTAGRVRLGARLIRDILPPSPKPVMNLIVDQRYSGWSQTDKIAGAINQSYFGRLDTDTVPIARALDDRTIRITAPEQEQANLPGFIGDIMSFQVDPSILGLPPRVVINQEAGHILTTADVEIDPTGITHDLLVTSRAVPPPIPTPENPLVVSQRWTDVAPGADEMRRARLQDLLDALNAISMPVREQIGIIVSLHEAGQLHAELIIE